MCPQSPTTRHFLAFRSRPATVTPHFLIRGRVRINHERHRRHKAQSTQRRKKNVLYYIPKLINYIDDSKSKLRLYFYFAPPRPHPPARHFLLALSLALSLCVTP